MRKSDTFYKRREILRKFEFPKQAEIVEQHGKQLTEIMNQYIPTFSYLKIPFKSTDRQSLWISPSDMLIPHVRLKPPLTDKYIRALTHEGILASGLSIQKKFQDELKTHVNIEMKLLAEKFAFLCKRQVAKAIQEEKIKSASMLEMELKKCESDYNIKLQKELKTLQDQMALKYETMLRDRVKEVKRKMKEAYSAQFLEITNDMFDDFNQQFENEKLKFSEELIEIITMEEQKLQTALTAAEIEKAEVIRLLQHDLECRNMANIMYILTAERNRFEEEKSLIYDAHKIKTDKLSAKIVDLYNRIFNFENICESQEIEIKKWRQRVTQICEEFQKFITYALKEYPKQAEFLLDLQNFVNNNNVEKHDNNFKLHDLISTHPRAVALTTTKEKKDVENIMQYNPTEIDTFSDVDSQQTLNSQQDLPKVLYNRHVYVREDFRNKNSTKLLPLKPQIWEQESLKIDFENQIFETDDTIDYPINSSVKFNLQTDDDVDIKEPLEFDVRPKRTAIVPPSRSLFNPEKAKILSHENITPVPSKEILRKNIQKKPKLLLSRNSLILYQERLWKNNKQSLRLHSDTSVDIKEFESSKIASVKDSVELIIENLKKKSLSSRIVDDNFSNVRTVEFLPIDPGYDDSGEMIVGEISISKEENKETDE